MRRILTAAALVSVHAAANAWFFFMIPLPRAAGPNPTVSYKPGAGEVSGCVPLGTKVGDRINTATGEVEVKWIYPTDTQCASSGNTPMTGASVLPTAYKAARPPEAPPTPATPSTPAYASIHHCAPANAKIGDAFYDAKRGPGTITQLAKASSACSADMPNLAVVEYGGAAPKPAAAVVPVATTEESGTAKKLRELQQMQKDGLITQEDYDQKKQELLKAF